MVASTPTEFHGTFEEFISSPTLVNLGDILFALERIEQLLMAQQSPIMDRDTAAHYIGLDPEELTELALTKPILRPVQIGRRMVFRRSDLDSFARSLENVDPGMTGTVR